MPKGLRNWAYKDVCQLLTFYGFQHSEVASKSKRGSHEAWVHVDQNKIVEVSRNSAYPPRTTESMVRQSGLGKSVWRDWAQKKKDKKHLFRSQSDKDEKPRDTQ